MNNYIVDGKETNLIKEDWKFLVVLDTGRYDIFRKIYKEFFNRGNLKKAISPAVHTKEWLMKSFPDKYEDIIYISGNPYSNSLVVSKDFNACKHFFKVVDVWDSGWDNTVGQVPPNIINKTFKKYYIKYPKKRFILHYMQPHQPWISIGGHPSCHISTFGLKQKEKSGFRHKLVNILRKKIPQVYWWNIRTLLRINPKSNTEKYYREHGKSGMIKAYTEEYQLALKHVKQLIDTTNGCWLITADHGEQLGEKGWYDHPKNMRVKEQLEVPWFKIKGNEDERNNN